MIGSEQLLGYAKSFSTRIAFDLMLLIRIGMISRHTTASRRLMYVVLVTVLMITEIRLNGIMFSGTHTSTDF